MAFVPVPNTAQVEVRYTMLGQLIENTLYFENQLGPWTATTLQDLVDDLNIQWKTQMMPLLPSTVALREVYARDLTTASGLAVVDASGNPTLGALVGVQLPNNVSLTVSFRTALAGRSFRGRNYWPALTEGNVTGNVVSSTFLVDLVDAYEDMAAAIQLAHPVRWVVVSRFNNGAPRAIGVTTDITSVTIVDDIVDSQRRRLPGRGL